MAFKGRADYQSPGDWNAICSICGFKGKASEMVKNWQGLYRHPRHNEPRHPQDYLKAVPDNISVPWSQPRGSGTAPILNVILNKSQNYTFTISGGNLVVVGGGVTTNYLLQGATTLIITIASLFGSPPIIPVLDISGLTKANSGLKQAVINGTSGGTALTFITSADVPVQADPAGSLPTTGPYTLTAATFVAGPATLLGFTVNVFGAITPTTYNGSIIKIIDTVTGSGSDGLGLTIAGAQGQSLFTSMTINGQTFTSAGASTFQSTPSQSSWSWANQFPISVIGTYTVTFR